MTKIITVTQQKGGATKTTTCINLAGALIEAGYSVLVADMNNEQRSASKWAQRGVELKDVVVSLSDRQPKKEIEKILQQNNIQFFIIDTPPELMTSALKAALLSDLIIIPCPPSPLDLEAAEETVDLAETASKPYKLLASNVRSGTYISKQFAELLSRLGPVFKTTIHQKVSIVEAAMVGQWIGSYVPNSDAHREYQALALEVINDTK